MSHRNTAITKVLSQDFYSEHKPYVNESKGHNSAKSEGKIPSKGQLRSLIQMQPLYENSNTSAKINILYKICVNDVQFY